MIADGIFNTSGGIAEYRLYEHSHDIKFTCGIIAMCWR